MKGREKTHAYPVREGALADVRLPMSLVVDAPLADCWLCQRDLCVQTEDHDTIVHMHRDNPLGEP